MPKRLRRERARAAGEAALGPTGNILLTTRRQHEKTEKRAARKAARRAAARAPGTAGAGMEVDEDVTVSLSGTFVA